MSKADLMFGIVMFAGLAIFLYWMIKSIVADEKRKKAIKQAKINI